MIRRLVRFLREEDGPTAVEYAVMLALIVGAALIGITFLGTQTHGSFDDSRAKLASYMNGGG